MENLLRNAWKFTRNREKAAIEVAVDMRRGQTAYFVRDNGTGFDPENARNLFGTFQRLHHSKDFEGHGIGLATVERIIKLHGGTVEAEGKLDEGATFWFTLGSSGS
jgi:light-regulated signal transduction histidine kinase (bacteriophytochrome)